MVYSIGCDQMDVASTSCNRTISTLHVAALHLDQCRPHVSRHKLTLLPSSRSPLHRPLGGLRQSRGCSEPLHIASVNPLDLAWGTSINFDSQAWPCQWTCRLLIIAIILLHGSLLTNTYRCRGGRVWQPSCLPAAFSLMQPSCTS